jgi:hypothetical protein
LHFKNKTQTPYTVKLMDANAWTQERINATFDLCREEWRDKVAFDAAIHAALDAGLPPNAVEMDKHGFWTSVLQLAMEWGFGAKQNTDLLARLLAMGATPEPTRELQNRYRQRRSPLMLAIYYDCIPAAALLVQAGANVNYVDHDGWTPLYLAVYECHNVTPDMALYIMDLPGVDLEVKSGKRRDTALDVAIERAPYYRSCMVVRNALRNKMESQSRRWTPARAAWLAATCIAFTHFPIRFYSQIWG